MKNHTFKLFLSLALLAGTTGGWSAPAAGQTDVSHLTRAAQGQMARANQELALAQKIGLLRVYATWERCEIKEYRIRRSLWGSSRKLRLPWNCQEVRTECAAVPANGHLLVPAACFYAAKREKETLTLKGAVLARANGAKRSILGGFLGKAKDFAVFTLK